MQLLIIENVAYKEPPFLTKIILVDWVLTGLFTIYRMRADARISRQENRSVLD